MSLIQDALKRQAEETAGMRLPGQPVQPIEPPPQQQQQKPPELKKKKELPVVPLILFLVIFLAALLGLSIYLIKPRLKTVPKVVQKSVSAKPVALPAAPKPVALPAAPEPVKVVEAPVAAAQEIVEPVAPPVTEQEGVAESILRIKKPWPELKLTGIAQGDKQSLAILNGKMLSAGRKLGEVTVIQVQDNNVIVEYRGERRTLYIGE